MIVESLDLRDYRNYKDIHIDFDRGTNLLYGNNAQGKTNILESVYYCAAARSHRGSRDREMIRFGCEEAHIRMKLLKKGLPYVIDIHLKKNSPKGIAVNSVPVRRASELFGTVHVICFSPEDLEIIKDGPAVRRRFIDMELCQLEPLYVHALISYNKILLQRSSLMKNMSGSDGFQEMLDVIDEQLVEYGTQIIRVRERFIEELRPVIQDIHRKLTGNQEELSINYEKDTEIVEYSNRLKEKRREDIRQKITSCGPHRDDLAFIANGVDLRRFGSQGQQRTASLSLKLAEIELVRKKTGDDPVLLLDDVLSELDGSRQDHLLRSIGDIQTIITCTGQEEYMNGDYHVGKIMHVTEGSIDECW